MQYTKRTLRSINRAAKQQKENINNDQKFQKLN